MRILIAAALTASALSPVAQSQEAPKLVTVAPAVAAQPANYAEGYRLAQAMRDEPSLMLEVSHIFNDDSLALLAKNPEIAPLEEMAPGVVAYAFRKARPELEAVTRRSIPSLWDAMARIFVRDLTPAEMAQIEAYYVAPAGKRLKTALLKHYDYMREIAPLGTDLDAKTDPAILRDAINAAVPDAVRELSAADRALLIAFSTTPAFRKLQPLNPRILEIVAAWSDSVANSNDPDLEKAIQAAVSDYLDKQGKKP